MSHESLPMRQTQSRTSNSGVSVHRQHGGSIPNSNSPPVFNSYMSVLQVQEKLKNGQVIEGILRINAKNYEDAYITAPDGAMDISVGGIADRNGALHGDNVAVEINHVDDWKVLHDKVYAYLEGNSELQSLVYKEIDDKEISDISSRFESVVKITDECVRGVTEERRSEITDECVRGVTEERRSEITDECVRVVTDERKCEITDVCANNGESEPDVVIERVIIYQRKRGGRGKKKREKKKGVKQKSEQDQNLSLFAKSEESPCHVDESGEMKGIKRKSNVQVALTEVILNKRMNDVNVVDERTPQYTIEDKNVSEFHQYVLDQIQNKKLPLDQCTNRTNNEDSKKLNRKERRGKEKKKRVIQNPSSIKSDNSPTIEKPSNFASNSKACKDKSNVKDDLRSWSTSNNTNTKCLNIYKVMRLDNWTKLIQKTAKVVLILEKKHPRIAAGLLHPFSDMNTSMALFSPFDNRIPRLKIPMSQCPSNFLNRYRDYADNILLARITVWTEPKFAFGELVKSIGNVGDIEAETEAVLLENNVDYSEFPESINDHLPHLPWTIPEEEILRRTDLRQSVIFTIDPSTARDLDDAVSCMQLSSGNLRIGVHIADVSYFVKSNTSLDSIAADRATSVYLTEKVIPMLPRTLCENLCSLNPGEDRLTVSVIWEMTPSCEIVGEWFGRTVIRSCAKLSYEHVQSMIERPLSDLNEEQFPQLFDGHSLADIFSVTTNLQKVAVELRAKRNREGALRLDQPKLCFSLDKDDHTPNGLFVYEQRESNKLIEEFMLLANMSVARKIYSEFPKIAVLRKHPAPHEIPMENTVRTLLQHGIRLDASSSSSLSASIGKYIGNDDKSMARMHLITNLCSKPMQFARYFCTGVVENPEEFRHYALNVLYYTHFTSPIRRYADIMVHRLITSAMDPALNPTPTADPATVEKKAAHCNDKRQASKLVQTASADLYLALFVRNVGELTEKAVVIGVLDRAIDVLIFKYGVVKRCYMEKLPLVTFRVSKEDQQQNVMTVCWQERPEEEVKIAFLDFVTVVLRPFHNKALKFNAILLRSEADRP